MNKNTPRMGSYLFPILIVLMLFSFFGDYFSPYTEISVDQLVSKIEKGEVKEITSKGREVKLKLSNDTLVKSNLPREFQDTFYDNYLKDRVEKGQIKYTGLTESNGMALSTIIPSLITLVGVGFLFYILISKSANAGNQASQFAKNRAKLNLDKNNHVKFKDVAGLKEEKEEMYELVDFLRNPKKYIDQGARIPKGVLLMGQPGTGKTYLSKAVAGEAEVPFYSISGSDFVEMYVGVGASRVRDMFTEAKKNAPCIIFIDEIDAVGRKRGSGLGGGHDEREQTLNQLLVEMDGFSKNEGIIIIAATNRPDILDPALLRPGRFDRTIQIGMPDVREREEILQVHTRNKKLASDVNLANIAKATSGFSPAELENLTNEAALLAARYRKENITSDLIEEAAIKVMAGPEKKSAAVIERERKLTAYHEAGHAVTAEFLPELDPVHIITIVPRGNAGGFTAYIPEEDKSFRTRNEMKNRIVSLLGGRAAEELILDDISTGASNDIERATQIARSMVKTYGFSDKLGPILYNDGSGNMFLGGNEYSSGDHYSEQTAVLIDSEVTSIIKDSYDRAKEILSNHKDFLEELAQLLLKQETIRKAEYDEIAKKYSVKENISSEIEEI
ncbi:ATP-dependent zinc metalloprotease FtsH [Helcococcus massiliensis]|uniref:ATP-dependent zinc metalloprotease FtsH n=1 Tax=Helcococcus massiliensis TaxID=2040290 RepID=UPI000CDF08B2|nr:ATP-dependent zinc metalloprotease FtsH [Helcococcus massiliensis]